MNGYANTGRRCLICDVIQKCLVCSRDSSNPKERLVILAGGRVELRQLVHETGLLKVKNGERGKDEGVKVIH
ncbi:unnamed protein product [Rhizophagus irregularis]|nr:unnamed protein product [Rhizophagus irregularis]